MLNQMAMKFFENSKILPFYGINSESNLCKNLRKQIDVIQNSVVNYHSGNEQNWIGNYDSDIQKYIHNDKLDSKNHSVQVDIFNQFRFPQLVPISNGRNNNILDFVAEKIILVGKLTPHKITLLELWFGCRNQ